MRFGGTKIHLASLLTADEIINKAGIQLIMMMVSRARMTWRDVVYEVSWSRGRTGVAAQSKWRTIRRAQP